MSAAAHRRDRRAVRRREVDGGAGARRCGSASRTSTPEPCTARSGCSRAERRDRASDRGSATRSPRIAEAAAHRAGSRRRTGTGSCSTAGTSPPRSGEPEISLYASAVSAIPAVRRASWPSSSGWAGSGGGHGGPGHRNEGLSRDAPQVLSDGRSGRYGPRRRTRSSPTGGPPSPTKTCFAEMEKRDRDDGSRADSPLTLDDRYVLIDSTGRPVEAVVDEIEGTRPPRPFDSAGPANIGYCFAYQRLMRGDPLSDAG